jgi:hypothetical protein
LLQGIRGYWQPPEKFLRVLAIFKNEKIFLRWLPIPSHHPVEQLPEGSRKPMEIFSRGFASIPVKN